MSLAQRYTDNNHAAQELTRENIQLPTVLEGIGYVIVTAAGYYTRDAKYTTDLQSARFIYQLSQSVHEICCSLYHHDLTPDAALKTAIIRNDKIMLVDIALTPASTQPSFGDDDGFNEGLVPNDTLAKEMRIDREERLGFRSYNELLPGERNFVTDCIEADELDVPRFFVINGEIMDIFMFENTNDPQVFLYEVTSPGRWVGEYDVVKVTFLNGKQSRAKVQLGYSPEREHG